MATVSNFVPSTGSEAEWNAAFYRLEDYFRALRLVNKVQQSQVILRLLRSAAARHVQDPGQSPTALAMEEARAEMDRWFERAVGAQERLNVEGLISLLAIDAPERWPLTFSSEEIPDDLRRELLESEVRAGPNLQVSSMTPRPIDVGPLLDPINLTGTWGNLRRGLAIVTLFLLAAASVVIFLIAK
jgi:hypothetical protein